MHNVCLAKNSPFTQPEELLTHFRGLPLRILPCEIFDFCHCVTPASCLFLALVM